MQAVQVYKKIREHVILTFTQTTYLPTAKKMLTTWTVSSVIPEANKTI
jgi:hypothetical protein